MNSIEKISNEIYLVKVELPNNALKYLNSYLIISENKKVLVDTGMNSNQSLKSLNDALLNMKLSINDIESVIITHLHIDHVGLIKKLREINKNLKIFIHAKEKDTIKKMIKDFENENMLKEYHKNLGFPNNTLKALLYWKKDLDSYLEIIKNSETLNEEEYINIGNLSFKVLWTPGHTPGHICLYLEKNNILLSGDHILPTITPNLSFFIEGDPLLDYLNSLRKIEQLNPSLILPGHEHIFNNVNKRIVEIRKHHEERLREILRILENKELNAYQIASNIEWKLGSMTWDSIDYFQKYLAISETLSHLIYLENKGLIEKTTKPDNTITFKIKTNNTNIELI